MDGDEFAEAIAPLQLRHAAATPELQVSSGTISPDLQVSIVYADAAAGDVASSAAATPDVGIGTISGSAFGSSLPQILPSGVSAASASENSADEEEKLWDDLYGLKPEQFTAVMEDAGAVLWSDGAFLAFASRCSQPDFDQSSFATDASLQETGGWRQFIPDYADIFAAVNTWMDERDDIARGGWWEQKGWWKRHGLEVLGALGECRWWAVIVLVIYEIANLLSFALSLELSGWARYNLFVYLVLHSAAFFKLLWMGLSVVMFANNETVWSGKYAETDLLLVSIAVLVRARRQNPSSFPKISLLNIMRDARCVFTVKFLSMGLNNLIAPECPHGTATMVVDGVQGESVGVTRGVGNLAAWQVQSELRSGIGLASKPEPNSSNPNP